MRIFYIDDLHCRTYSPITGMARKAHNLLKSPNVGGFDGQEEVLRALAVDEVRAHPR